MSPTFIHSLISGHLFSKGVTSLKEEIANYYKGKEFSEILNEYDSDFFKYHDTEIAQCDFDMESVIEKRALFIILASKYLELGDSNVGRNRKREFVKAGCSEIDNPPKIIETYLNGFYDLYFMKETKDIPDEYRALINHLADSQHVINEDYEKRITNLERTNAQKDLKVERISFESFYQSVEKRFTAEKNDVYKNLVGSASDEKSYIEAYITVGSKDVPVLGFLNNWFGNTSNRTILIYGEPGQGKSLLCDKAMVDFHRGIFLKERAKNVLAVSLSTGQNRKIINEREIELENTLFWRTGKKNTFSFEQCQGALLFMDGFDEFIDEARHADTGINNIYDFMRTIDEIATQNDIHIVVLSRAIAVKADLKSLDRSYQYYKLSPISEEQQDKWIEEHNEYDEYKEDFCVLRNNRDMQDLLGVPLLFRLIVHNRFRTISSNIVELYENLFIDLLKKRFVTEDEKIQPIEKGLMNLAFKMYCTDTNMAYFSKTELDRHWEYAFYVIAYNERQIGFFHRSFYQFFLAKYIYSGIVNASGENVEDLIGSFAERQFDETVRYYLSLMYNEKDKLDIQHGISIMVDALAKTEAYLNLIPKVKSGDAEKSRILRSQNIYRNIFYIVAVFSYIIKIPFKGNLDVMVRKYTSEGIVLTSEENERVDLKEACLAGAYLRNAKLSSTDMTKVDLRGADLRGAYLINVFLNNANLIEANLGKADLTHSELNGAILRGAFMKYAILKSACLNEADMRRTDLTGANLIDAHLINARMRGADLKDADLTRTDLTGANMRGVDLRGVTLNGTIMRGAYLRGADLSGATINDVDLNEVELYEAKIDIKYKDMIDASTKGYSSIVWGS